MTETDVLANKTVTYNYNPTGDLVSQVQGGKTYYYNYDGQGNVVNLTDSTGAAVVTYSYDSWGQKVNKIGTLYNPITYVENDPVNFADPNGEMAGPATRVRAGGGSGMKMPQIKWDFSGLKTIGAYASPVAVFFYVWLSNPTPAGGDRISNVDKNNSSVWKKLSKSSRNGRKQSGKGSKLRYYEWDYTHNDIEVYDSKGRHLGSMDPIEGKMYKGPVKGRRIEI